MVFSTFIYILSEMFFIFIELEMLYLRFYLHFNKRQVDKSCFVAKFWLSGLSTAIALSGVRLALKVLFFDFV